MPIGSSHLPAPAEPPEIHDIGIMSVSDDQATVDAAVGLEPAKGKDDGNAEVPGVDGVAEGAGQRTETGAGEGEGAAGAGDADGQGVVGAGEGQAAPEAGTEGKGAAAEPDARTGVQKRIDALAASVANKDQHIDVLTRRLEALERGRQAPPAEVVKPAEPPKFAFPSFEEFQEKHSDATYEDYSDARADARFDHLRAIDAAKQQADSDKAAQDTATSNAQALLADNTTRMDEFIAQHPTFTQTLKDSKSPMTQVMEETFMRSQIGPAMAMFLAGNTEEATRIAQIQDSFSQALAVVRLETHPDVVALAQKVWPNGASAAAATAPARSGAEKPSASADGAKPKPPVRRGAPQATPLEAARGSAGKARELSDMHETENAEEYIRERDRQNRERGKRR